MKSILSGKETWKAICDFLPLQGFYTLSNCYPPVQRYTSYKRHQNWAIKKLISFVRIVEANIRVKELFITKLIKSKEYRRKYLYIHHIPIPHLCLKRDPPFFLKRGIQMLVDYMDYLDPSIVDTLDRFLEINPVHTWQYYFFITDDLEILLGS